MSLIAYTLVASGYLIGSISSAIIVCKLFKLPDPRGEGSLNPGATNVLRIGGKKPAAITLFADMLKGAIPVAAAAATTEPYTVVAMVGFAAFLGHLYPVFFSFKGGKGVATALGVLLGWHWQYFLLTAAIWLVVSKAFKISSLAALIAFALTPLYLWWLGPGAYFWASVVITLLIFIRHKSNIRRLFSGSEEEITTGG